MKFTNKEEYLTYRKNWKIEYANLSNIIRYKKKIRKFYDQSTSHAFTETNGEYPQFYYCKNEYFDIKINDDIKLNEFYKSEANKASIFHYKSHATQMLEELKLAKQEANRQYLESKTKELTIS